MIKFTQNREVQLNRNTPVSNTNKESNNKKPCEI